MAINFKICNHKIIQSESTGLLLNSLDNDSNWQFFPDMKRELRPSNPSQKKNDDYDEIFKYRI